METGARTPTTTSLIDVGPHREIGADPQGMFQANRD